jgi:hypothetical protein
MGERRAGCVEAAGGLAYEPKPRECTFMLGCPEGPFGLG